MLRITPFSPSWQEAVCELILQIQRDEFKMDISLAQQPDLLDIPHFYQQGAGHFWLATDGVQLLGTIGLRDIGDGQLALRKMFVRQGFRGSQPGIAGRLLQTAIQTAKEQQSRAIFLGTTEQFVAAHRFYEKHGFQHLPPADLPPAFPRMQVDTRFYRLPL